MIKRFEQFILENTDSTIEIIEDCFLEFCDEYDLDIDIDKGHLVNDNYITARMLPELLQMAKDSKTDIDVKECHRVQLYSKNHRYHNHSELMPDLKSVWKNSINDNFLSCLNRATKMTNLEAQRIPKLEKTNWSITIYLI